MHRRLALHEPRIPVPAPATVLPEAQIFLETAERSGSRPMRQVVRDRISGFLDGGKTLAYALGHEADDLLRARKVKTRSHINEHDRGKARWRTRLCCLSFGDQRR